MRRVFGGRANPTVAGPFITAWNADWNASISDWVPMVMRAWVGQMGHDRPIITLRSAIASITSFAGRLVSSMKKFDSEGTYEYPWRSSQSNVFSRMDAFSRLRSL